MNDLTSPFLQHFSILEDPRVDNKNKRYSLDTLLVIALLAILSGADSWTEMEDYAEEKFDWLSTFLDMSGGVPSHDTFGRVFSLLDPVQLQTCFLNWINSIVTVKDGEIIAIDGKCLRNAYERGGTEGMVTMLSAWAVENQVVLGQAKVEGKSNEITAIPGLIDKLSIKGATVTVDAIGCQKKVAKKIKEKEAEYVLALKGNQGNLHKAVKEGFDYQEKMKRRHKNDEYYETIEKGHGRIEKREYWLSPELSYLGNQASEWEGLNAMGRVKSTREIAGKATVETRYYLCSADHDVEHFAKAVRNHWCVENQLHWSLDVSFKEDHSMVRVKRAAENFAVLRHIAVSLLKQENSGKKKSINSKRRRAGWNDQYLLKLLEFTKA